MNEATDVWEDIDACLLVDDIPAAAARLRRYMEYIAGELGEALGSSVQFRLDGDHDLGEVLPNVIGRFRELLSKAASAAQAWKDQEAAAKIKELKKRLGKSTAAKDVEQWAVNKAVHYNAWADFVKQDFEPIVKAFKNLLDCFKCPNCDSLLTTSPRRGKVETIRCDCNRTSFNLKEP